MDLAHLSPQPPAIAQRDEACGFQGNPDLYGLGIRLGIYFQWVSAYVSYMWNPKDRKVLAEAYLAFLFALLIAMFITTGRSQPTYVAEIFVLTLVIFGGNLVVLNMGLRKEPESETEVEQRQSNMSLLELSSMALILNAAAIYTSWFWLGGIDVGFLDTPCGTFGFLFTKVSLRNQSITKAFAALSMFMTIIYVFSLCLLLYILLSTKVRYFPMISTLEKRPVSLRIDESTWHGAIYQLFKIMIRLYREFLRRCFKFSVKGRHYLGTAALVYSILGIELTLYWNSVTDINTIDTSGQLIPFVIGLLGLAKACFVPIREVRGFSLSKALRARACANPRNDSDIERQTQLQRA